MRNTLAITLRETRGFFFSPMAYVISGVFLAMLGVFFANSIAGPLPEATVRGYVGSATFILLFLAPILTMRLLAEEQKQGTIELLLTSPVRDWEVVLGKFVAAFLFFLIPVVLSFYFALLLFWFGDPDTGPILTGYLGLLLYGAAGLSIGIFASSLTSNQIVSAVVGFGVLLLLYLMDFLAQEVTGPAGRVLTQLSITGHFDDFSRGVIDTGSLVYYLSVIAAFLFLTVRVVEMRRWR